MVLQAWGGDLGIEYYSPTAVIFIAIFALLMIGIGIAASRYQTNQEEYFAAGRRAGILVIAISIFASVQSGWGMVGVTGSVFNYGFEYMLSTSGVIILGFAISYWLLGRKMRMLGEVKNAITVPDAMYYRFNDERIRLLGAASVLFGSMGYLAAQYAALGIIGALILPVGFYQALILGLIVIGFYTVIGGMLAAIWSDAIQGIMMIIGGVLTAYYVITGYPNGFSGMISSIQTTTPAFFDFTILGMDGLAPIGFILSVLVIQLTVAGQPQAITKFYMIRDISLLKWGALITGSAYLISTLYWWSAPFVRAAVAQGTIGELPTPDATLPVAVIEFAPDIVVAFVLTAVIAAIMSTSNAFLNMGASAVVHDLMINNQGMELTDQQEVRWSRIVTGFLLITAGILAATFPGLIFVLGAAGWALFASVIFPCVAIAYNWRGATAEGALWGSGTGFALTIIFAYAAEYLGFGLPLGVLGGQLAMMTGFILFVGVSKMTDTSDYGDLSDDIQDVMDLGRIRGGSISRQDVAVDGGKEEDKRN